MVRLESKEKRPNSESIEKGKIFSIAAFIIRIRECVYDYISGLISTKTRPEDYLQGQDGGYLESLKEAIRVGEEAGLYHERMTQNSLRGTNLKYNSKKETLGGIHDLELAKHLLYDQRDADGSQNFQSDVVEIAEKPFQKKQLCFNRFERRDGQSVIEECVENIHLGKDDYFAYSSLAFQDLKTGKRIDLNRLLPKRVFFVPSEFYEVNSYSGGDDEEKKNRKDIDLRDYKSFSNPNRRFYARSGNIVGYGNLTENGGMIALLHEIAHSWQLKYRGWHDYYEKSYIDAVVSLWMIAEFKKKIENNEGNQELNSDFVNRGRENLKKQGIEINESDFVYHGQKLKPGEMLIKEEGISYVIKSPKFEKLLFNLEKDERDAWAHALMTIRYLRRKGIDLEPSMKTLKDFKKFMDPCLDTYQQRVSSEIETCGRKIKFLRKDKESK